MPTTNIVGLLEPTLLGSSKVEQIVTDLHAIIICRATDIASIKFIFQVHTNQG